MRRIINQLFERKPLFEPLGIRSLLKELIESNKMQNLKEVFEELRVRSQLMGGVEIAVVVWMRRVTGEIIDKEFGEPGTLERCYVPRKHRKYMLRPGIIQILIHPHLWGEANFSDPDNKTIQELFLLRSYDEAYVVTYDDVTHQIKFKRKVNTLFLD